MEFFRHTLPENAIIALCTTLAITVVAYSISVFYVVAIVQYQFLFAFLFGLIITTFIGQRVVRIEKITSLIIYLLTGFIVILVATTGWFDSPYVFTFYLLVIVQSFFFPAIISIAQVASLVLLIILVPEIGSLSEDFLFVMSVLGIIPVSIYLREQFLNFKEAQNSIIILKKNKRNPTDSVQEIVNTNIRGFSLKLQETLVNIKLQAYKIDTTVDLVQKKQLEREIIGEATRALKLVKSLEEDMIGTNIQKI